MSLFPAATQLVTWKRATAIVLEQVAVSVNLNGDRPPARASAIQVQVTGAPTGTVTVSGNVDGSPDTEQLSWSGSPGYRVTTKEFEGSLTFTTSLTGATNIDASAVGQGGEPTLSLFVVKGPGHPVSIEDLSESRGKIERHGEQEVSTHRLLVPYEEVWTPRLGDRVVMDRSGAVYEVLGVEEKVGGLWPTHWACRARRLDARGTT